jgi:hypothetical protein
MQPINHTALTLGELLSSTDPTLRRGAIGILKRLQAMQQEEKA